MSPASPRVLLLTVILLAIMSSLSCGAPARPGADSVRIHEVQSSALRSVGYDGGDATLVITFQSGSTYEYSDVPRSVYDELMAADSKGGYFNSYIKNRVFVPARPLAATWRAATRTTRPQEYLTQVCASVSSSWMAAEPARS